MTQFFLWGGYGLDGATGGGGWDSDAMHSGRVRKCHAGEWRRDWLQGGPKGASRWFGKSLKDRLKPLSIKEAEQLEGWTARALLADFPFTNGGWARIEYRCKHCLA